jgi:hypothetical protein
VRPGLIRVRRRRAQKAKVINDAMKLLASARLFPHPRPRMILLFADQEAARQFSDGTWRAAALSQAGIEVMVAPLDDAVRARIRAAQVTQFR